MKYVETVFIFTITFFICVVMNSKSNDDFSGKVYKISSGKPNNKKLPEPSQVRRTWQNQQIENMVRENPLADFTACLFGEWNTCAPESRSVCSQRCNLCRCCARLIRWFIPNNRNYTKAD